MIGLRAIPTSLAGFRFRCLAGVPLAGRSARVMRSACGEILAVGGFDGVLLSAGDGRTEKTATDDGQQFLRAKSIAWATRCSNRATATSRKYAFSAMAMTEGGV